MRGKHAVWLVVLLGGFASVGAGCASKPALPWCADNGEQTDCSFVSYQQCRATISGQSGSCFMNPGPIGSREQRRAQRRP